MVTSTLSPKKETIVLEHLTSPLVSNLPESIMCIYYLIILMNLDLLDETAVYARNVGIEGDINEWTQICGFAYQPNPERDPGKLIVQFPQGKPGDYWILGTDYESYAVVYSCFEFNGMVSLQAWIITRDPQPELETIEKGLDILVANGIDVADFVVFPHDNCDYSSIDDIACEPFDE